MFVFSRHNEKNDSAGPGPGQYNITGLSAKGLILLLQNILLYKTCTLYSIPVERF